MNKKKEKEKNQIDFFLKKLNPDNNFIIIESERPDFIIQTGEKSIGIEVTEIYTQQPIFTSELKNIVEQAKLEFEKISSLRFNLHILFNNHAFVNFDIKRNRTTIRDKILTCVEELISIIQLHQLEVFYCEKFTTDYQEISALGFCGFVGTDNNWDMNHVGWFHNLEIAKIIQIISKKDKLLKSYQPLDSQWLILIVKGNSAETFYFVTEEIQHYEFNSMFNKVFIFDVFKGKILELKTSLFKLKENH